MGFMDLVQSLLQILQKELILGPLLLSLLNHSLQSIDIPIDRKVIVVIAGLKGSITGVPILNFIFQFIINMGIRLHSSKHGTTHSLKLLDANKEPHASTGQLHVGQDHQEVNHIDA